MADLQNSLESMVVGVESDYTEGSGNGRRRARLCRRLKHVDLCDKHKQCCLTAILQRLKTGRFSQNFKDELGLAVHLDAQRTYTIALSLLTHPKQYIARSAAWVVNKILVRQVCSVPQQRDNSKFFVRPRYIDPAVATFYAAVDADRIAWLEARDKWFIANAYHAFEIHLKKAPIAEDEKLRALRIVLSQTKANLHKAREELHAARIRAGAITVSDTISLPKPIS